MLTLVAVAFVWRPWLQRRRYGTRGIVLFRRNDRAQLVRECLGAVLVVLLLAQAIAAVSWPESLAPLIVLQGLERALGAVLLVGGMALLVAAQLELGASWRIGIEEGAAPGLVTGGLYRFSRNPIFLALVVVFADEKGRLAAPLCRLRLCPGQSFSPESAISSCSRLAKILKRLRYTPVVAIT